MLQDVAEADECREVDATPMQVVDELLEIDRSRHVLGRMNGDMAVLANSEVSLAPTSDFVHLTGIDDRPRLADVVRRTRTGNRVTVHAQHDIENFESIAALVEDRRTVTRGTGESDRRSRSATGARGECQPCERGRVASANASTLPQT